MWKTFLFLCVLMLLVVPYKAMADGVVGNWAICDSCVSPSDFESAARVWYGDKTIRTRVNIGNPNSGVVYGMWISRTSGRDPLSFSRRAAIGSQKVLFSPPRDSIISAIQVNAARASTTGTTVEEVTESVDEEPVFRTLTIATRNHLLYNVDSSQLSQFPSLAGSLVPAICNNAWTEETKANPSWANFMGLARTALGGVLKEYFGRGVLVSQVFANGDVATFELIPGAPSGCLYVKNSAMDRMGNPLPDPSSGGGFGGSANGGVTVGGSGPTPRSYSLGGSDWLICGYVGGVMTGCYVLPRQG